MSQYVTSQANVGKNRNVKPKTPQLLSQQPVRFDPSGIGKIRIYRDIGVFYHNNPPHSHISIVDPNWILWEGINVLRPTLEGLRLGR